MPCACQVKVLSEAGVKWAEALGHWGATCEFYGALKGRLHPPPSTTSKVLADSVATVLRKVKEATTGDNVIKVYQSQLMDWWTEVNRFVTSSTAQGGGGSFKNRKPIGEIGCCESGMAERSHWWTERCLISLTLSFSFSGYLPTYSSIFYVSIYLLI